MWLGRAGRSPVSVGERRPGLQRGRLLGLRPDCCAALPQDRSTGGAEAAGRRPLRRPWLQLGRRPRRPAWACVCEGARPGEKKSPFLLHRFGPL